MHVNNIHLRDSLSATLKIFGGQPNSVVGQEKKRALQAKPYHPHETQLELHQAGCTPSPAVLLSDDTDMGQGGSSYYSKSEGERGCNL